MRVEIPDGYRERKRAVERDVRRNIGRIVKMRRVGLDMSQVELARHIGMTEGDLSRKVNGHRAWSEAELLLVAEALDLSVGDLFQNPDQMVQSTPPGIRTRNPQIISSRFGLIRGGMDVQPRLPGWRWVSGKSLLRAADSVKHDS